MIPLSIVLVSLMAAGAGNAHGWLEQVQYLISDSERKEFLDLAGSEDRDRFIEEFWRSRDLDPSTERNEFREAYLARVEQANRDYGSGSDRARIFVLNGKPDQRLVYPPMQWEEPLPVATRTQTPQRDGGIRAAGVEGSRPAIRIDSPEAEIWTYYQVRSVAALAGPLELIFMKVPGGELSVLFAARHARNPVLLARMLGNTPLFQGSRTAFSDYTLVYAGPPRFAGLTEFYRQLLTNPASFDTLDLVRTTSHARRALDDAPERRLTRRKLVEEVQSALFFAELPGRMQAWRFQGADGWHYLPFFVSIPGNQLDGVSRLEVVAEIRRQGKIVAELEDHIDVSGADRSQIEDEGLTYQSRFAVGPGLQTLRLWVLDRERGRIFRGEHEFALHSEGGFELSDLVVCRSILPAGEAVDPAGIRTGRDWLRFSDLNPLRADQQLMVPSSDGRFRRKDRLTLYFEVYRPELRNDRPRVQVKLRLFQPDRELGSPPPVLLAHLTQDAERKISYAQTLDLGSLPPGSYRLRIEAIDTWAGAVAAAESGFEVH